MKTIMENQILTCQRGIPKWWEILSFARTSHSLKGSAQCMKVYFARIENIDSQIQDCQKDRSVTL